MKVVRLITATAMLIATLPVATLAQDAVINGVEAAKLESLADTLKKDPSKGRVTFYAHSRWQDGMRAFTSISGYKVDGKMLREKERQFVLLGDESQELGGTDAAPGAVEEMMYALGTCIIAAANANAVLSKVKLTHLDVKMESDLDLHGLFGLDPKVRPGVINIRVNIGIGGDGDDATLRKIATAGYEFSPVSETIRNGLKFTPEIRVVK